MPASRIAATAPEPDRIGGYTMGTTWSVALQASGTDLHVLHACAQNVLDGIVARMSHWEAASDLCRYNRAPPGWVDLPADLVEVLACALDIARDSGGAFDPTLGELATLWGFGPQGAVAARPAADALADARARAGWQRLRLDRAGARAYQPGGLRLDLSAIAKGYAVDRVADALRARGMQSLLVEVGGELRGIGSRPDGAPWRVLVETGQERDDDACEPDVLALDGLAVATSGDAWHRHRIDGRDHAHTLDPSTGAPRADAPMAATVLAPDAMRADAWATALSVVSRERALSLAEAVGLGLRLVERMPDGLQITRNAAFEAQLCS